MKAELDIAEVSTKDLVQGIRACSRFLKSEQIGNPEMGNAFLRLAQAIQPLSKRPLEQVLNEIRQISHPVSQRKPNKNPLEGLDLPNLTFDDVEQLLASGDLAKKDIIRLGHERLGLTEGRLRREPTAEAIESIRATMRNRDAMRMMEEESRRVALQRTT